MKITTFAAIYIGSYEVSLKVFEISPNRKIRPVDYVRSRLELGRDAYRKGVIGYGGTLSDIKRILFYYGWL